MTLRVHAAGFIPVSRRFHWLARAPGDPFRMKTGTTPARGAPCAQARPGGASATVARAGSVALSQRQEKPMTGEPDSPTGLSFERDVRPMFREKDRDSMLRAFDLWSYSDVHAHQDAILERLSNGTMPCDGAWPPEHVAVSQHGIPGGSAP